MAAADQRDLLVIVENGSGSKVTAVAEIASEAIVKQVNRSALYPLVEPGRRAALDTYLRPAKMFDYVEFARVFDLRAEGATARDLLRNIGVKDAKNPSQGTPRASTDVVAHAKLLSLINNSPSHVNER
ncbi:MAG: hypothetical protein VXW43_17680, partial [Pseudomonadota bacterium]|nr:hypothetical protein [Pseudomonadota bacterium]